MLRSQYLALALSPWLAAPAVAAPKPCEELKTEIAAKLDAAGVKAYTLSIVPADQVGEKKVVGQCDAGRKRITYERG
ncbi:DUF1161 domain-containing protein [Inhella gelatinilytica]|uniref:DUF1161 domain-containing protein n=1 Tax=Inhella gelatinilytica TaxID=2795030 RepID=A0A931NDR5_9BURK|nr:DUF1161 domain-containing protein [Inhella gelatinilytica]MBH9552904.1 DUF1161 domain-containing protein [Inhella gelatinilytica]